MKSISSAIFKSVEKECHSYHHRWCHLQLLQYELRLHGGIKQNRMVADIQITRGTSGTGADSIIILSGRQDFLEKCIPRTHFPGRQIFLRHPPLITHQKLTFLILT